MHQIASVAVLPPPADKCDPSVKPHAEAQFHKIKAAYDSILRGDACCVVVGGGQQCTVLRRRGRWQPCARPVARQAAHRQGSSWRDCHTCARIHQRTHAHTHAPPRAPPHPHPLPHACTHAGQAGYSPPPPGTPASSVYARAYYRCASILWYLPRYLHGVCFGLAVPSEGCHRPACLLHGLWRGWGGVHACMGRGSMQACTGSGARLPHALWVGWGGGSARVCGATWPPAQLIERAL